MKTVTLTNYFVALQSIIYTTHKQKKNCVEIEHNNVPGKILLKHKPLRCYSFLVPNLHSDIQNPQ